MRIKSDLDVQLVSIINSVINNYIIGRRLREVGVSLFVIWWMLLAIYRGREHFAVVLHFYAWFCEPFKLKAILLEIVHCIQVCMHRNLAYVWTVLLWLLIIIFMLSWYFNRVRYEVKIFFFGGCKTVHMCQLVFNLILMNKADLSLALKCSSIIFLLSDEVHLWSFLK